MTSEQNVRTRAWRNRIIEADDVPFEQTSDYRNQPDCPDYLVWTDVCAPDKQRVDAPADGPSLDPQAIEDPVERHERLKAHRRATHLFRSACEFRFARTAGRPTSHQVAAFVLRNAVVTLRQSEDMDMDQAGG